MFVLVHCVLYFYSKTQLMQIIIIINNNNNNNNLFNLLKLFTRLLQLCFDKDFLIPREKEPPGSWEVTCKPWDKLFTLSPVLLFLVPFWLFCISLVFYSLKCCFNSSVNYVIQQTVLDGITFPYHSLRSPRSGSHLGCKCTKSTKGAEDGLGGVEKPRGTPPCPPPVNLKAR